MDMLDLVKPLLFLFLFLIYDTADGPFDFAPAFLMVRFFLGVQQVITFDINQDSSLRNVKPRSLLSIWSDIWDLEKMRIIFHFYLGYFSIHKASSLTILLRQTTLLLPSII